MEKSTFQLWPAWRWFKYCYKKLPLLTIYINILLQINDWAEILSLVFFLEYSILFGAIFHIKDIFQNLFQCWVALLVQTYCQCVISLVNNVSMSQESERVHAAQSWAAPASVSRWHSTQRKAQHTSHFCRLSPLFKTVLLCNQFGRNTCIKAEIETQKASSQTRRHDLI